MGYKTQNAYEGAERERVRSLPWRLRYDWRGCAVFALIVAIFVAYAWAKFLH